MTYTITPTLVPAASTYPQHVGSLYLSDGTFLMLVPVKQPDTTLSYNLVAVDQNRTSTTVVVTDVMDTVLRAVNSTQPGICRDSTDGIYVTTKEGGSVGKIRYLTKGAGLTWTKQAVLNFTDSNYNAGNSMVWCNTGGGLGGGGHLLVKWDTGAVASSYGLVFDAGIIKQGSGSPLVNTYTTAFPNQFGGGGTDHNLLPNDDPGVVGAVEGWWTNHSSATGVRFGFWTMSSVGVLTVQDFASVATNGTDQPDSTTLLRVSSAFALLVHRSTTAGKIAVTGLTRTGVGTFTNSTYGAGITGWNYSPPVGETTRVWDAAYDRAFGKVWLYALSAYPGTALMRIGGTLTGTTGIAWDTVAATTEASGLPSSNWVKGPSAAPPGSRWDWQVVNASGSTLTGGSTLFNQPPYAPPLTGPASGAPVNLAITQRLSFTFADPDVGDSLSKFDIQWSSDGGTSWTTVTRITPYAFWDADPATFPAGTITWHARCYDAVGTVGPYSADSSFTAATTPGVPTITAPTSGSTISTPTATVTWSTPSQTNYQVRKVDDATGTTVYYDSGDVLDAATRSVVLAFPVNARWEHIQVKIKAAGLWSSYVDCRVWVNYDPPMVPTIVVTTDPTTATIRVAVTNPTPTGGAPATSYNDIYVSSPLDPEYRAATLVPPNSTWVWWTPGAGRAYTVRAVAVGTTGTTATSVDMVVIDGGTPTTVFETISDGGTP